MLAVEKYSPALELSTDLSLALLRGQSGPVNIGLKTFKLLIPLSFVLGPFPLNERSKFFLRGESGPGVIFREVVSKNAGEYAQQGVEGPVMTQVRAYRRLERGFRPREQNGHLRRRRG